MEPHLDAGDRVFVTLPYAVIDRDNQENLIPTAKIRVRNVLSNTQLELGRLVMDAVNRKGSGAQQVLAAIQAPACVLTVERATGLTLNESNIKKAVKNPPTGAFSSQDISVATVKAPRGVFQLLEGTHFKK